MVHADGGREFFRDGSDNAEVFKKVLKWQLYVGRELTKCMKL